MRLSDLITGPTVKEPPSSNGTEKHAPPLASGRELLPLKSLKVDPVYQRDVKKAHVARLVDKFDPEAVGMIKVGRRPDSSEHVVDGQHRREAMLQLGYTHAWCDVYHTKGVVDEARLFAHFNDHRRVELVQLFRALIAEGDAEAVEIRTLAERAGWTVMTSNTSPKHPGDTCAVDTLISLYRRNRATLFDALCLLLDTWPEDPRIGVSHVVRGMFLFLTYGSPVVNRKLFTKKLASAATFGVLLRRAKSRAAEQNLSPAMGVAHEFAASYNSKLPQERRVSFDRAD